MLITFKSTNDLGGVCIFLVLLLSNYLGEYLILYSSLIRQNRIPIFHTSCHDHINDGALVVQLEFLSC